MGNAQERHATRKACYACVQMLNTYITGCVFISEWLCAALLKMACVLGCNMQRVGSALVDASIV